MLGGSVNLQADQRQSENQSLRHQPHAVAGGELVADEERSAVIYSLLGSCRRHGLNPFDYLKDLFTRR
jgi:hypothetical protein